MAKIGYFVPGSRDADEGVVPGLRRPIPAGVVRAYVETYTDPGEMVVVPYCQGPAAVRETLALERQVLALHFDPLLILVVRAAVSPLPVRELDAAVARLGDSLKQDLPLRRYLTDLYATTCPACLRAVAAEYFVWERDQGLPIAKHLHCPSCAWEGRAVADAEDRERLAQVPARGMHYHYLLDRIAPQPQGDPLRARLESLLEFYSPRSLYALAELTLKIESLFPDGPVQHALKVLLLDCLDRCSSLAPLAGSATRWRGLSRPNRFLERNVWQTFEEAVTRLREAAGTPVSGLADALDAFRLPGQKWSGAVAQGQVRDLARIWPPRTIRLILISPPPLDSAVWSLSYLWGAWLLGSEAVASLRPLLRQRTPDAVWYARVMAGSFAALADLLRDDGRIVLSLTEERPAVVEAMMVAAGDARLGVATMVQSGADYRIELAPTFPQPAISPGIPLPVQIQEATLAAATETIQMRGEPVPWRTLHAAIYGRLAERGLLARASGSQAEGPSPLDLAAEQVEKALDSPDLVRLAAGTSREDFWWLAHAGGVDPPLSDRVEATAYRVLQGAPSMTESDFSNAVLAQFVGRLTPATTLVAACLRAYAHQVPASLWQLRPEDRAEVRETEVQTIVEALLALGQRLGYRAERWPPFDAAWFQEKQVQAAFVVRWRASLSEALALGDLAGGAGRYLVIPGGRAALLSYKLTNNPVWQRAVEEAGWAFVKYRHVRQLAAQPEVDEYALRAIVGLDPIVEREQAQLPLF